MGPLVLLGGAVQPRGAALRAFLTLSRAREGGAVVAFTTASGDPSASARQWQQDFRAAGCPNVAVPIVASRRQAFDPHLTDLVAAANGIFLGGGDQVKLVSTFAGSPLESAIVEAHVRGIVIGGTSAGAAALAKTTLAGNEVDEFGNLVDQYIGPGLGLVRHPTIIDTHFSQRRRLYRLFVAVAQYPDLMGMGIDEDTALVVQGDVGRVEGTGGVTFVDGRGITYSNAGDLRSGQSLTLSAMRVGIVGAGHSFNLRERELLSATQSRS
jgi:cyanophycinase